MFVLLIEDSYCSIYGVYVSKNTVFYWLIAVATITFSKQKGATIKQGQLLNKSDY